MRVTFLFLETSRLLFFGSSIAHRRPTLEQFEVQSKFLPRLFLLSTFNQFFLGFLTKVFSKIFLRRETTTSQLTPRPTGSSFSSSFYCLFHQGHLLLGAAGGDQVVDGNVPAGQPLVGGCEEGLAQLVPHHGQLHLPSLWQALVHRPVLFFEAISQVDAFDISHICQRIKWPMHDQCMTMHDQCMTHLSKNKMTNAWPMHD